MSFTDKPQRRRWRQAFARCLGLIALCGSSCTHRDPAAATQLLVTVEADPQASRELRSVQLLVYDADAARKAGPARTLSFALDADAKAGDPRRLPLSFGMLKTRADRVLIVLQGYAAQADGAPPEIEHKQLASFQEGKTVAVRLRLADACLHHADACPALTQTCATAESAAGAARECIAVTDEQGPPIISDAQPDAGAAPGGQAATMMTTQTMVATAGMKSRSAGMSARATTSQDAELDAGMPDAMGCARPFDGGACDPVAGCGCRSGLQCQLRGFESVCVPEGPVAEHGVCHSADECAAGSACHRGVCRRACRLSSDCDQGVCIGPSWSVYGYCFRTCGADHAPCPADASCVDVKFSDATRKVCAHMQQDVCVQTDDGYCDEVGVGSGLCPAGSDIRDCCRANDPNGSCDLISLCGCGKLYNCTVNGFSGKEPITQCYFPDEQKPLGSRCNSNVECTRGAGCNGGLCRKFCANQGDCNGDYCQAIATGDADAGFATLGACWQRCDFDTNQGCAPGAACLQWPIGAFCGRSLDPCPLVGNNVCDEDTRLCAAGTDSDCAR